MGQHSTWAPAVSLEMMDKNDVATALLSPVQRVVLNSMSERNERSRTLARRNNEYGARLVSDHPGRFGHFAALPLPDQDGSLREIEYAFGTLKADGIGLWTSYVDKWLGDPAFWPAFEELNRRNAVVFVHPARPACCGNLPGQSGIIDYDLDTARAIDTLLWQGTVAKFPNVRFIFVHSGGAMSVLAARVIDDLPRDREHAAKLPNGVEYEFKKLYFDVAHGTGRPALAALKELVPISQVLYGSDVPLRQYDLTNHGLDDFDGFSRNDLQAIFRGNAERLFPRLKA
jgi:predicted TIM-barrel fold metal-dependent hydrolase